MLEIINSRVFIDGKETVSPEAIGHAILDLAENPKNGKNHIIPKDIDGLFTHGDIVYLKHDIEQHPRMVTQIIIEHDSILYELASGSNMSVHRGYEMSKSKTIY